jgi:hypothetical protein
MVYLQGEMFFPYWIERFLLDRSVITMSDRRSKEEGTEGIT